ncbi:MAG: hypothetical protein C0599_13485 [Salinivirgaceae bacterium]|nr:MAG: hypothetical protein C0599_13485 [Salinivirgaceae bacterium]
MSLNQNDISLNTKSTKKSMFSMRELIGRIIKLNSNKNNIDVAITSDSTKKTIIITENLERSIFRLGQFFKQKRRDDQFKENRWNQLIEAEALKQLGADIYYSNDTKWQKTCTIVIKE